MRVAAVQLHSTDDKDRNLDTAARLTRDAARAGAELVVLPEKFNLLGTVEQLRNGAEPLDGPTVEWARALAQECALWLVAGSIVEHDRASGRFHNTSTLIAGDGEIKAVYRKIHMFDVEVGDVVYRESELEDAGDEIVQAQIGSVDLGLAVCYDLRFPELFRILAIKGARVVSLPSAFTMTTGKDHWEVLLRARAVENQLFMVAAGQLGEWPPGHEHYGRSMIVDPWGVVLATAPDHETFVWTDLDFSYQDRVRTKLPALAHRRPTAYRWPEEQAEAGGEDP